MTEFRRKAHQRRSVYGTLHDVIGHKVNRLDWERAGMSAAGIDRYDDELVQLCADASYTARLVQPNANCPVCNEPVFFYQNEFGSRVYFDELGPPWPKHPCTTDLSIVGEHGSVSSMEPSVPYARVGHEVQRISEIFASLPDESTSDFVFRFGKKPWLAAAVIKRIRGGKKVFLVLTLLGASGNEKVLLSCNSLPRCIKEHAIMLLGQDEISFFDLAMMEPIQITYTKYASASKFIDALISSVPPPKFEDA